MTATTHPVPSRVRSVVVWAALLAACAAAIALLHRLGADPTYAVEWRRLWGWLGDHSAERALLGLGRVAALALAYWLAGTTIVYTVAGTTRIPGLIRSVEWMTLPPVRRLAERVVALSLTASTLATPAAAFAAVDPGARNVTDREPVVTVEPGPRYVPVPAGDAPIVSTEDDDPAGYLPTPAGSGDGAETSPRPFLSGALDPGWAAIGDVGPEVRRRGTSAANLAADRTVRPGDHLWAIAESHLTDVLARSPSASELATYWAHLVEVNRPRLRSGNPDLIFPGEVIACPPTRDVGISG